MTAAAAAKDAANAAPDATNAAGWIDSLTPLQGNGLQPCVRGSVDPSISDLKWRPQPDETSELPVSNAILGMTFRRREAIPA